MNSIDQDIETIAQILLENTTYSPQVRAYVIHGAIQKLIEWRDSYLKENNMQLLKTTEPLRYSEATIQERKKVYIIMNAARIWKGRFFDSLAEAAGVLRSVFNTASFKTFGDESNTTLINEQDGSRYTIISVDQYRGLDDVKPRTMF